MSHQSGNAFKIEQIFFWLTFCTFLNRFDKIGSLEFILNHLWCKIDNFDTILDHFFPNKPKFFVKIVPSRAMIAIKAMSQAGQLSQAGQGNCSKNTIALPGTIATINFG